MTEAVEAVLEVELVQEVVVAAELDQELVVETDQVLEQEPAPEE
jgi:hypothetical protein